MKTEHSLKLAKAKELSKKGSDVNVVFENEKMQKLHEDLNTMYETVKTLIDNFDLKAVTENNADKLKDLNNTLVKLISRFEQGVTVKNFDKIEKQTAAAVKNFAELQFSSEVKVKNPTVIPTWLAKDETIKKLNKDLVNLLGEFNKALAPKGQSVDDFVPFRRVRYQGGRLQFDDASWAMAGGFGGGGGQLSFTDGSGNTQQVSSSHPLPVEATIDVGDIEIGAVELKNGTDDTRATVTAANALKVDGSGVTQPVSGSVTANAGTNLNTSALALDATLTGGTQLTKITNGTQAADTSAGDTGQNYLLVGSSRKEVTFTTTTVQAVAATDVSNYRWVGVQIVTQGTTSTVTFQASNDNINWVSIALTISTSVGSSAPVVSTTAASSYSGPLNYRYFRLNVTGISAGTTAGVIEFFSTPAAQVQPGGSTILTQLALADNVDGVVASATVNGLKTLSSIRLFDGTNFNRWQQAVNATNSIGTGIAAAAGLAQFDDVSPTAITENSFGNLRMSANRNLYGTIRDAAGNERGANVSAAGALNVDGSAVTQPVNASTATGGVVPANAYYNGVLAQTALPSAATAGNLTGALSDKFGRQVVLVDGWRDIDGDQLTTISASTAETTVATAAASTFLDITSVLVSNTSATAVRVDFRDTTGGSVRFPLYVPAGDTRGIVFHRPRKQTTVNTNWTAQCSASVTDVRISMGFINNK